jgi:hypothetical protein
MRTLSFIVVVLILSTGHSYADSGEVRSEDLVGKAPHEKIILDEYEKLMNGQAPVDVTIPTDLYGIANNDARVLDQERIPGKVGRAPAVVGDVIFKEFNDPSKVDKK